MWALHGKQLCGISNVLIRSLFPILALVVILGSIWWGAWGSLLLTLLSWRVVARIG